MGKIRKTELFAAGISTVCYYTVIIIKDEWINFNGLVAIFSRGTTNRIVFASLLTEFFLQPEL